MKPNFQTPSPSTKSILLIVLSAILTLPFTDALAQDRMDRRQNRQEDRIEHGKSSGELTEKESQALERGQDRIEKMENKAKSDGTVKRREAHRIEKMQDRQSRRIHRMKHNERKGRN